MTAPKPITRQRVEQTLRRHGIEPHETLVTELIDATRRSNSAPTAIQIVQEYAEYTPPKAFWESAQAEIKDLGLWEKVVAAYVAAGWNCRNLSGMFEFYRRGELPEGGQRKTQPRSANALMEYMQEIGMDVPNGR